MNERAAIARALHDAGRPAAIVSERDLSGGCIHQVRELTLEDDERVVVKIASARDRPLFDEEAAGLRALAQTEVVLVPEPLAVSEAEGTAVLLMTALRAGKPIAETWARFGIDLASLHAADSGSRYGFTIDNHLGRTFQPNAWCDDWVDFNTRYRLGYQLELAQQHDRLEPEDVRALERVIEQLDRFLPRKPEPSLLHGDLWSGNALPAIDSAGSVRIALIDPACSIGDGWADIAMMKLFGGFPQSCFDAYTASRGNPDEIDRSIAVYQLYHVLNHLNLFGKGYAAQAMGIARSLTIGA